MEKIKMIKIILAVLYAVYKTVSNIDWIFSTSQGIHAMLLKWLYPFLCVDPTLVVSVSLLFGAVFICVLLWNVLFNVIMAS